MDRWKRECGKAHTGSHIQILTKSHMPFLCLIESGRIALPLHGRRERGKFVISTNEYYTKWWAWLKSHHPSERRWNQNKQTLRARISLWTSVGSNTLYRYGWSRAQIYMLQSSNFHGVFCTSQEIQFHASQILPKINK